MVCSTSIILYIYYLFLGGIPGGSAGGTAGRPAAGLQGDRPSPSTQQT